MSSSMEVVER